MNMIPLVSIVIVSMNRMDLLRPCLESIRKYTTVPYELFVVAYMFSEENLSALREEFPWVKIVMSEEVRGFSENNNLALRQVSGKYTFIVNDDTYIDSRVIDNLVADFSKLPENAAAVSPKVVFPSGKVQTCGRKRFTPLGYIVRYCHFVDEAKPSKWTMREGLFQTYNLNGAAFLVRTDFFKEIGWFDERFFFTPEDIAVGTVLNEAGYKVYADSNIVLYHIANSTASRMEAAIKPARVRGCLIFYSSGRWLVYFLLGTFCWCFETLRAVKYLFKDTSDPSSFEGIMAASARNVRRSIFTRKTPKELFMCYYLEMMKNEAK